MEIQTKVNITDNQIETLLCSAIEGGSNYWAGFKVQERQKDFLDNVKAGQILVKDYDEDSDEYSEHILTIEKIQAGLQIMAEKYPWHFNNIMTGNDDAETADVFIQCSLFEDIVYG